MTAQNISPKQRVILDWTDCDNGREAKITAAVDSQGKTRLAAETRWADYGRGGEPVKAAVDLQALSEVVPFSTDAFVRNASHPEVCLSSEAPFNKVTVGLVFPGKVNVDRQRQLHDVYSGQVRNQAFHGKGWFIDRTRDAHCIGDFDAGWFVGGHIEQGDGAWYRGETEAGRPHGRGRRESVDGKYYEGDFRHGQKHGRGTFGTAEGPVGRAVMVDDEMVESEPV